MDLNKLNEELEGINNLLSGEKIEEESGLGELGDKEEAVLNSLADAFVSGLSRVEMAAGVRFETPKQAFDFLNSAWKKMRSSKRGILLQKLRVFERVGAERSQKKYKKGISRDL